MKLLTFGLRGLVYELQLLLVQVLPATRRALYQISEVESQNLTHYALWQGIWPSYALHYGFAAKSKLRYYRKLLRTCHGCAARNWRLSRSSQPVREPHPGR